VSQLAEANGRSFDEELAIFRKAAAFAAGHAHDSETYVPTGRSSGAPPSGSQSVADAGLWLAAQSEWSLEHLRAVVNVRGRSPAQVQNRMKLAQILATARSEELFTAAALAGALGCAKRTVERWVSLVRPADVPDVDQAVWEDEVVLRKNNEVVVRKMSPEQHAAELKLRDGAADRAKAAEDRIKAEKRRFKKAAKDAAPADEPADEEVIRDDRELSQIFP
jgi:hypothetical protein